MYLQKIFIAMPYCLLTFLINISMTLATMENQSASDGELRLSPQRNRILLVCTPPQYESTATSLCEVCPNNCTDCTTLTADGVPCTSCVANYSVINDLCCHSTCSACQLNGSVTECTTCISANYAVQNGNCCHSTCSACQLNGSVSECTTCISANYAVQNGNCCHSTCSACQLNGSVSECTTCISANYAVQNGNCCHSTCSACQLNGSVSECTTCISANYAVQNGNCCHSTCSACQLNGSVSECTTCISANYAVQNGNCCHSTCSACQLNGPVSECTTCISANYAVQSGICCHSTCSACQLNGSVSECTTCISANYAVQNGNCCHSTCSACQLNGPVSECTTCISANYAVQSGICCHKNCSACQLNGSVSECTTCNSVDYTIQNGICCHSNCSSCFEDTSGVQCAACNPGFLPLNNLCCVANCNSCTDNGTGIQCGGCFPPYYLNGSVCSNCSSNCWICASDGLGGSTCSTCTANYFVHNGICCDNSCSACAMNGATMECSGCSPRYYLSGIACPSCIDNCAACIDGSTCNTCDVGYVQYNQICCHKNCTECTFNSGITSCTTCVDADHLVMNGKCCHKNCTSCSSAGVCLSCKSGYYVNNGICCNQSCSSCSMSGSTVQCSACNSGFKLIGNNCCNLTCTACNDVGLGIQCTSCVTQYYRNTLDICEQCPSNCSTCIINGTQIDCTGCIAGFYLTGVACAACSPNCNGCTDGSVCTSCINPYFVDADVCVDCDSYCLACTGLNACTTCQPTYYLNSGSCSQCDLNCLVCTDNGIGGSNCSSCTPGYTIYNGLCCDNKCDTCTINGYNADCDTCKPTYYLTAPTCTNCVANCTTCSDNTTCSTCATSYYVNISTNLCSSCSVNCLTCADDGLSGSTCSACIPTYFVNSGLCSACDANCTVCTGLGACTTCSSGYIENAGACDACVTDCLQCPGATCTQCSGTHYLLAAACPSCNPSCVNCEDAGDGTQCTSCIDGYYVDVTKACVTCVSPCVNCTDATVCITCITGKYHNAGSCLDCIAPCITCTNSTNCLSCEMGTYLSGTSCLPCISPCINCNVTGTGNECLSCIEGFSYNASTCTQCGSKCETCLDGGQTTQCLSCKSTQFRQPSGNTCICKSMYYEAGADICQPCTIPCNTCTGATTCITCADGYFKSGLYQCLQCQLPCENCTSLTTCTSCVQSTNRQISGTTCPCDAGFYEDGNSVCPYCVPPCLTCVDYGNGQQCKSCISGLFRTIDVPGQTCPCDPGYYNTGQLTCQVCTSPCSKCTVLATRCTECVAAMNRNLVSQACPCITGYFDPGATLCQQCTSPCATCITTATTCVTCVGSLNRSFSSGACPCIANYYDNGTLTCQPCISPCANCQNAGDGTQCVTCISGYYLNTPTTCAACLSPCLTCTLNGNGTQCTTCKPSLNRYYSTNLCPCLAAYYYVEDGSKVCQPCTLPCLNCQNVVGGTKCTDCKTGLNRIFDTIDTCTCIPDYYENTGDTMCYACISPCKECIDNGNGTQCTTCVSGLNRNIVVAQTCPCESTYYNDGTLLCKPCNSPCANCVGSATSCTTCLGGLNRHWDGVNLCVCDDAFFQDGVLITCSACNYSCSICINVATECYSCNALKFRTYNALAHTCLCMDNYYDNMTSNQTCQSCTSPCQKCATNTDGTKCTSCVAGLNRHLSGNTCICDDKYYQQVSVCLNCYTSCMTCLNGTTCATCDVLNNQLATTMSWGMICICNPGYQLDNTGVCILTCPLDCATCDTNMQCLSCSAVSTRTLTNGRCTCLLEGGSHYCRTGCDSLSMERVSQQLKGTLNTIAADIVALGIAIYTQTITSVNFYSTCSNAPTLQLGIMQTNRNTFPIYYQTNKRIRDMQPFGQYSSYEQILKDKVQHIIFDKDDLPLDINVKYNFATSATPQAVFTYTVSKIFSQWKQQFVTITIDTFKVILVITMKDNNAPTITFDLQATYINVQISFTALLGARVPTLITQMFIGDTGLVSDATLQSIGDTIIFQLEQATSYQCAPLQKIVRQIIRDNHQLILSYLPIDLLPIQVTSGTNLIDSTKSSSKLTAPGGSIIQLNSVDINYKLDSFDQLAGSYEHSTVGFPDLLYFSISMSKQFTFTQFTIRHYVATGYSVTQQTLTYTTKLGIYKGYWLDIYGTTAVRTLLFGLDQGQNYALTQNAGNTLITLTGTSVRQLYMMVFVQNNIVQLSGTVTMYQDIFEGIVNLIIKSIDHCGYDMIPIRYFKELIKTTSQSTIVPANALTFIEYALGYYYKQGTAAINTKYAFTNSHKLSTDLNSYIVYTGGRVINGMKYFGATTTYQTRQLKSFTLGATLNGVNWFSVELQNNGVTVTCTQSIYYAYQGVTYLKSFISLCQWGSSDFQIATVYMVDLRTSQGITLDETISGDMVTLKLNGLINSKVLYYFMMVANKATPFTTASIITTINAYTDQLMQKAGEMPCNFQCQIVNANMGCATYRSGYQPTPLQEFAAPIHSDIHNIGGQKCRYFNFLEAKSNVQSKQAALTSYIVTRLPNRVNADVADGSMVYDAYKIGQLSSSFKSTPYIQSPLIGQTQLTFQTALYLGAQSQLYSYIDNPLFYTILETNINTVFIDNKLNPDQRGQQRIQEISLNSYGVAFTATCITNYDSLIFPNLYECILRPLVPTRETVTITNTLNIQATKYTIDQTDNSMMIYTLFADFSLIPISTTELENIATKIFNDHIDQTSEQLCVCWGRYRRIQDNCRCQSGYYPPTLPITSFGLQDCFPCEFRCKTCQFTDSQCLSCPDSSNRLLDTINLKCPCAYGFMDNNVINCIPCSYKCGECVTTINTCSSCKVNSFRTWDTVADCPCNIGYYDDGSSDACQPCHFSCGTCSGLASNQCIACPVGSNRIVSGGICSCNIGYYETNVVNCAPCNYTCNACAVTATTCSSCKPLSNRTQSGSTCPCSSHYYNVLNQWDCVICSDYCGDCTGPAVTQCINCMAGQNRILVGNQCQCAAGFYKDIPNTAICPACNLSCKTCSVAASQCSTCEPTHNRTYDSSNKICTCNLGFYDNPTLAPCQVCSPVCRSCELNSTKCLTCPVGSNRYFDSPTNTCPCLPTFSDTGAVNCLSCDHSCLNCTGASTNCTSCDIAGTFRLDQSASNKCPCQPGYYDDGNNVVCQKCHPSCKECSSYNICTACDLTKNRLDQSATFKCPCMDGFYDDNINQTCPGCHYSCQKCSVKPITCTACNTVSTNRITSGSTCPCAVGYFDSGVLNCSACNFKCEACAGTATQCTACPSTRQGASCLCKLGYIESGAKQCTQCAPECGTCAAGNINTCLSCNANRSNPPTCGCADGFIPSAGICTSCPNKCQLCLPTTACISCKGDRINSPDCTCPVGYFDDEVSTNCQVCYSKCALCTKTVCTSCLGNRELVANKCECPADSMEHTETASCSNCNFAVVRALFSSDLATLSITFPFQIQYPQGKKVTQAKACTLTFANATLALLGEQPICSISTNILSVQLGSGSTIMTTSPISIRSEILQKVGCYAMIQTFELVSFDFSTEILLPFFNLPQFPDPITLCQDIIINMRNVRVSGNRPFPIVQWSLVTMLPYSEPTAKYISELVTSSNTAVTQELTILKMQLSENGQYTFQLKAFNFRNQSYTAQTTFFTSSYEAPILTMDKTQQFVFGRWEDLAFTVSFRHLSCTGGVVQEIYDALRVNWTDISPTPTRLLQTDPVTPVYKLLPDSVVTETDGMTFLNTLRIPAYTGDINRSYTLKVVIYLTNRPLQASQQFTISIVSTPMQAYIAGGTRTQSFGDITLVDGYCRDPDLPIPWNKEVGLTFAWECINLVTGTACTDAINEALVMNLTAPSQVFRPRLLKPYQPLQFIMTNTKGSITLVTSVILLMIETDLPKIAASYPPGYDTRAVLLHEELNFNVTTDQPVDSLKYFCQILYDFEVVAVFRFHFLQVKLRIWDYFENVNMDIQQIQIKLAAKDAFHYLPAMVSINFDLNVPPQNCKLTVVPSSGTSITDVFTLTVSGCVDADLPITYQYHIYGSPQILAQDNLNGDTILKRTLTDPQSSSRLQTVLPTPTLLNSLAGENLIVMVSVLDSNFGMTNLTATIRLKSIQDKVMSGVDFNSILLQIKRALKLSSIVTPTNEDLPSLFIASQELSSLYLNLMNSPQKQTQMKPIMKSIYDLLANFQGKLTSKVLEESLLSSLSSVGRTGITFISDSGSVDIFNVKNQIKEVAKQLQRQINDLQYLTQQKTKSGGSTSKYEDTIKALDNTLLNTGYVTDTLFNAIKGDEFAGIPESDINLLKTQITSINSQVAQGSQMRSVANEKPKQFAGDQMGMTAYKSTPAMVTKVLSKVIDPSMYGNNNGLEDSTDLNGNGIGVQHEANEEDEIDYIKYFTEHPEVTGLYGINIPKKNTTTTTNTTTTNTTTNTTGGLLRRILQYNEYYYNRNNLAYRRTLVDQNPDNVKQYAVEMQNYQTSPYLQDPKFKKTLSKNVSYSVVDGKNVTNDNSIKSEFGTINPQITMSEDGQSQEMKELEGQSVTLQIGAPKNISANSTQVCFSEGQDKWQTGSCKLKKAVDATGAITFACECSLVNPTTVITNLDSLISNKINSVFNAGALDLLASIEWWKYAIFYVAFIFTGIFIFLMVISHKRDNEDFMQIIQQELNPVDGEMAEMQELKQEFGGLLKTIKEDEEDKEQTLMQAKDYKMRLNDEEIAGNQQNMRQLAIASLQSGPIKLQKQTDGNIVIKSKVIPKEDRAAQQIEYNRQQMNNNNAHKAFQQHDLMNAQRARFKGKAKKLREVIRNVYSVDDLAYENGQIIKMKPFTLKLLCEGVMTLHRVLSILMLYDDIMSRAARFGLIYSKTILVLALQALFSGNFGPVYSVLISVMVGQVINILLSIMTVLMKAQPILKFLGILFTICVAGVSWFIVIMLSATMDETAANDWAIQFISSQFSDLVVVENMVLAVKLTVYPWVLKAMHAPDGQVNTVSHLLFIAVAQPQIAKFFSVE